MRKNSSILKFVLKIILAILIFLFLFLAFLAIKDRDWETFLWAGKILAGCSLVINAICYIAYWLVTKYFGGTYSWCYEMDEDGIRYWQPEEQAEKARNIAKTSAAVGAVTGNLGLAAAGTVNALSDVNKVKFDKVNFLGKSEGLGIQTSYKKTYDTFIDHIEKGSTLIHDKERCHNILIEPLSLTSLAYNSKECKNLEDEDNPLQPINDQCNLLKQFLNSHRGFSREYLQDYLNLYAFMNNPPYDKLEKIEYLINYVTNNVKPSDIGM
ncbi:MAG: hypothetical protein IKD94_02665 [Erysipelotrichaceae bacterium]|nr:hypothetical protein [Erysipelotrichaceae bacterium]